MIDFSSQFNTFITQRYRSGIYNLYYSTITESLPFYITEETAKQLLFSTPLIHNNILRCYVRTVPITDNRLHIVISTSKSVFKIKHNFKDKECTLYIGKYFIADENNILFAGVCPHERKDESNTIFFISRKLNDYPELKKIVHNLLEGCECEIIIRSDINNIFIEKIDFGNVRSIAEVKEMKDRFINKGLEELEEKFKYVII